MNDYPEIAEIIEEFLENFSLSAQEITQDTRFDGLGIDPGKTRRLFRDIEDVLDIEFPEMEKSEAQTVGDVNDLIQRYTM